MLIVLYSPICSAIAIVLPQISQPAIQTRVRGEKEDIKNLLGTKSIDTYEACQGHSCLFCRSVCHKEKSFITLTPGEHPEVLA